MGPSKDKDIEDSESEHEDEKQGQEQARKELTLVVQKATQLNEKYVTNYKYQAAENFQFDIDQQCFLVNLLPPSPQIPKAMQIQCNECD